jgi:hypothetical protein
VIVVVVPHAAAFGAAKTPAVLTTVVAISTMRNSARDLPIFIFTPLYCRLVAQQQVLRLFKTCKYALIHNKG